MKTIKPDMWLAICVIVGALVYLYADFQMPAARMGDSMGPRAFPALVGCGLLFAGVLLLFEAFAKRSETAAPATLETLETHESVTPLSASEQRRQIVVLVAMVAWTALYYFAFEPVGYLLTTLIFLSCLLSYFHRGHHRANLLTALGFTLVVDLLFTHFLNVPLPAGIFSI